jgi:glutamate racemase
MPGDPRPIGVFDSGMGGLTVLRALAARLPGERFVYLGDTARLPYGTKSAETVQTYALQATRLLLDHGVKMLVIACNTASAVALYVLEEAWEKVPVIGVIEPGARAGVATTRNGRIAVIATEGTVKGGAYVRAIKRFKPDTEVVQLPCQVFVALAEEGWINSPATLAASALSRTLFQGPRSPIRSCWLHAFSRAGRCHQAHRGLRRGARGFGFDHRRGCGGGAGRQGPRERARL